MQPTRDVPIEPCFLEQPPFNRDYHRAIASDVGLPFYVDIPWPEDIPGDDQERLIDLAERILSAGGCRIGYGHQEEIRQSMVEWAPDRDENRDDDPGFWRRIVFSLSPKERNFGRLQGELEDRHQKAQTIIGWARDCIDEEVLREIEQAQIDDIEQAWRDTAAAVATQRAIDKFESDPPAELEGWTRFEAEHEAVDVAYHAKNSIPSVAAVFETADGTLDAQEFTLEEWIDSGGNPLEARPNRYCVSSDGDGAYARLRSHLLTFEAEPLAADTAGEEQAL
ncbi:hypothetical protein EGH22_20645 [Halomicroarcula sp. F28]|uniref:hypothetical protein n=1 Tax=Haloarcula salinisoli TaxID=2487746 RepID=UPI001C733676|nr:hypothetical protein [Halomicroarcula salinisoli]MBX0288743.1 hypothetical protein [Halomicroarcula salinisoli]